MPSAMSGENIKLTHPLCHELWKMVLSILFSYILSRTGKLKKILYGYGPCIEMGIVSYIYVSTRPQLGPVKISMEL